MDENIEKGVYIISVNGRVWHERVMNEIGEKLENIVKLNIRYFLLARVAYLCIVG